MNYSTTQVLNALGRMLADNYGHDPYPHTPALWAALLDGLASDTLDRAMLDEYLQDPNKGRWW